MESTAKTSEKNPLILGVITGQVAGLIMAVVVMAVFTLFLGKGPLYPVQLIGSVLFGESALHGFHLGALLLGLVLISSGHRSFGVLYSASLREKWRFQSQAAHWDSVWRSGFSVWSTFISSFPRS